MVGRDQELGLLLDRWRQAVAGEGQLVLLSGEAGIGKSRITRALRDTLASELHIRIRWQCSPYHTDSALFPVIQHFTAAAGFSDDDTVGQKLTKLEALLAQAASNVAEVAPLFARMLSGLASGKWRALSVREEVSDARPEEAFHAGVPRRSGALSPDQWPLPTRGRRRPRDLSTLRNWIDRRRERQMDEPPSDRQEDMAAELKRLRRENEVLRQEREILKRATAFFAKEGSR
jgi:hypothetical protein